MERSIALKIRSFVIPAIEKLRGDKSLARHSLELERLAKTLEELTSDLTIEAKAASVLSRTELQVASLIKHGLTTGEIAGQLDVSPTTVRTHRKSIRRKLKINSAHYSLKNFLLSDWDIKRKR